VDDERSIRVTLRSILDSAGYEVEVAEDTDQAQRLLAEGTYDVVLSDIVLPRVSGVMLLKAIREAAPEVQVIMMTGEPTVETAAEAVRAGAADYLVKPIPRAAVLRSLANAARVKALDDERRRLERANRQYQAQLERQNEELRKAAEFREEVEAVTRHDLKSPLNVIIAGPQLLLEMGGDNLTAKQREYLRMIEGAGRRMLEMINLSLDVFRMENGMYESRPLPVDVLEVLREAIRHQEPLARVRSVACEVRVDGRPPAPSGTFVVSGERLLLYSSFGNLLKNAIEASPAGETVTITLSGGDARTIAIRNRGAVPLDVRGRFFRKYTTAGKDHGTGLGAYSAKLMTQAQGGSIRLDASEEGATTIVLEFPPAGGAA
jgi:signal transduction histidine kinase